MKPENWKKLNDHQKQAYAAELFASMRGRYIVGQTLTLAIEQLKKAVRPEVSNIEDMQVLEETFFPVFRLTRGKETLEEMRKYKKNV